MPNEKLTALLGVWEGYEVGWVDRQLPPHEGGSPVVWIELLRLETGSMVCSGCGASCARYHDYSDRTIRDLPILGARTLLHVQRFRVACPTCGPKLEALPWLDRYERMTKRLTDEVARLCRVLPIKHVAEYFGLHWSTVKRIEKAHLADTLGPVDLTGVEVLAMDEFAIQKGHRYATVVVDPRTKRVLWVGRGRSREDVRPFFELLGEAGRTRIKAVAMDMNGAYEEEVKAQCPNAEIVYDLFHVVAKYGREVIDRVRVDEANRVQQDRAARRVIKGSKWLLLRNRENLKDEQDRVKLSELLNANRKLATVYVLKDDLKALWSYWHVGYARRFWEGWYRRAIRSRIEPLKAFARRLKERIDGALAHCRWQLHTSLLEGINNKIKVIKRMAYGYRDDAYFFLKIRQAFPGNA